jgi:wyosine [tRNA(Phe)-imidazoG37] synthetase (radical SAM superfamily)
MKYIFGPVPSRRLGQSLGIDTIPLKTCNWNCVYCQLGRTVPLINARREYVPREDILAEVKQALDTHIPGEIDWVTFVGSGEPTLHASIGLLIRQAKALTDLPVAVITNGALLYLPEVRAELTAADAVLPTLDAGTPELYRWINRPHPDITFERLVEGLIAFRRQYTGRLWIEVMLVRDLNNTEPALRDIAAALRKIGPDEVHINLPTRPPAEPWVQPPDEEGLMRATAILGNIARVVHPVEGTFDLGGYDNLTEAIVGIITRHPMREAELRHALERWSPGQVEEALAELEASGRAQVVERYGARFWSAAASRYPDEAHSRRTAP